jgi:hypothetical protein
LNGNHNGTWQSHDSLKWYVLILNPHLNPKAIIHSYILIYLYNSHMIHPLYIYRKMIVGTRSKK